MESDESVEETAEEEQEAMRRHFEQETPFFNYREQTPLTRSLSNQSTRSNRSSSRSNQSTRSNRSTRTLLDAPQEGDEIPGAAWWVRPAEEDVAEALQLRRQGRPLTQLQRRQITGSLVTPLYDRCQICFDPTDRISVCDNACQPIPMCEQCERTKADCPICRQPTIKETLTKTEFMDKLDPSHQIAKYRGVGKRVPMVEPFRYGQNVAVADSVANDSEAQDMYRRKKQALDERERLAKDTSKRARATKHDASDLAKRLVQLLTADRPPLQEVEAAAVEILSAHLVREMDRMETAVLLHLLPASQVDLVRALRQHQVGQNIPSEAQVLNSIRQRTKGTWSGLGRRMDAPAAAAAAAAAAPEDVPLTREAMREARVKYFTRKEGGRKRRTR